MDKLQLDGASRAEGLLDGQGKLIERLARVLNDHYYRNAEKMEYYEDRNKVKNLGLAVPNRFLGTIRTDVGWAAKAVDYLASRCKFDSYTASDDDVKSVLDFITAENDLSEEIERAIPSVLIHGCGFWTVTRGEEGEQEVVVNFHDATDASALWDYRHKRILAGLVIEDWEPVGDSTRVYRPSMVVLHTSEEVVEITRVGETDWKAEQKLHPMGRPLMEPMTYRASNGKPFGKSRISRAVMAITDEMQREIVRTALHSECFSAPQKYMLGASDEAFDMDKFRMAYNSFMLVSKDADGDVPQLGQFTQASMEPHIAAMESLMSRMAAETSVPVAAFGLSSNGYTSSDALRASTDDLILEAESMNRSCGRAMRNVAIMALATLEGKSFSDLAGIASDVTVHWIDPSMPTISAVSNAMVQQVAAVPDFGGTSVFWERLGYNADERRRIEAEIKANTRSSITASMFGKSVSDEIAS